MLSIYRDSDNISVIRKKQIDTLKIFNANVSEVQEDIEYKVEFVSGGKPFAIVVKLGQEFPLEKPVLHIVPIVSHQWVSDTGEITSAPGLLNFTPYSDLGRVVQAIVREFELRPPPLLSDDTSPPSCGQRATDGTPLSPGPYVYSTTPPGSFRDYKQQTVNSVHLNMSVMFPELNSMTLDELKKLNASADRLDEFVDSTPTLHEMKRSRDEMMTRIEEISKENISKEPLLVQRKQEILELQEVFSQRKARVESLIADYEKLADHFSPQNIRVSLQAAVVRSDEKTEQIAEQFLNGEMDLDSFLVAYGQGRMLSHCRKTKEEKLSHQLLELQRAGF